MAFPDPGGMVYIARRIVERRSELTNVYHDVDGDWMFTDDDGPLEAEDIEKVHLGHVLEEHPEVAEVGDLPAGWHVWRERAGVQWWREESSEEEL